MANPWQTLLSSLGHDPATIARLLQVTPLRFRTPSANGRRLLRAFSNADEQIQWMQRMWDRLARDANGVAVPPDQILRRLRELAVQVDAIPNSTPAQTRAICDALTGPQWNFAQLDWLARLRERLGPDGADYGGWLLHCHFNQPSVSKIDLKQLMTVHPSFRTLDANELRRLRPLLEAGVDWDHAAHRVRRTPNGQPETIQSGTEFGVALQSRAHWLINNTPSSNRVSHDLDLENTVRQSPPWRFRGQDYVGNFPGVDLLLRRPPTVTGAPGPVMEISQVTHGKPGTLVDKFRALTWNRSSAPPWDSLAPDNPYRMIEDLQMLGLLATGPATQRGSKGFLDIGRNDYFSKMQLLVPADCVEAARLAVMLDPSFPIWRQHFTGTTGLPASRFLEIIQPLPAGVIE